MKTISRRSILPALLIFTLFFGTFASAAPDADLWSYWKQHDPSSQQQIDHTPWKEFLAQYLVQGNHGINRVQYEAVSKEAKKDLDQYVSKLEGIAITEYSRPVQMAYWINLYNALTVKLVLEHEPVDSIRDIDISPGWFSSGPWGKKLLEVEGKELSLNDIEHRILRPIWKDNRIHYAVNCASMGCPNLQNKPFTADNLETLLERGARQYVNHPRGVRIKNGAVYASKIYFWYMEDFEGTEQGVLEHLRKYAKQDLREKLKQYDSIDEYRYDWRLNDTNTS